MYLLIGPRSLRGLYECRIVSFPVVPASDMGTVLHDCEVSTRFRVKRAAGRVHLNSDLMVTPYYTPYAHPQVAFNPLGQSKLEWNRTNEKGHLVENVCPGFSVLQVCISVYVDSMTAAKVSSDRKLTAHKSCVNSLSFSRNGGRWLASAGDGKSVDAFHPN